MVKSIILCNRVAKAVRSYALTRKTEREIDQLMNNLTDDLTTVESDESFAEKAEQILVATRQHGTLENLMKENFDGDAPDSPWSIKKTQDDETKETVQYWSNPVWV